MDCRIKFALKTLLPIQFFLLMGAGCAGKQPRSIPAEEQSKAQEDIRYCQAGALNEAGLFTGQEYFDTYNQYIENCMKARGWEEGAENPSSPHKNLKDFSSPMDRMDP